MKIIQVFFLLLISQFISAQNILNIVPMPAELTMGAGTMVINNKTTIVLEGNGLEKIASLFNEHLQQYAGYKLKITNKPANGTSIFFNNKTIIAGTDGSYDLTITNKGVRIAANNSAGVFWGMQTLLQILPTPKQITLTTQLSIPELSIKDHPRFVYRGMHLDVGRHFISVEGVKRFIDHMATYKFNTFHWHLTDDQGWRIEIKKYPLLTQIGAYRNGTIIGRYPGKGNDSLNCGGFYTQEEIKDIVQYASDRFITIIPEIEMPGHSSAAIAAYPQLSCFPDEDTQYPKECTWAGPTTGKHVQQTWGVFQDVYCPSEYTFSFLEDVLDEVMSLFPSKYIHVGGDECPKQSWKRSAFCQDLMKEKKQKDENELQSYFMHRIEDYVNSKGRKIIGWDEILEGDLGSKAVVMSWHGQMAGTSEAKQHHYVIMTPESPLYFNYSQSKYEDSVTQGGYNPLDSVYNYEPVSDQLTVEDEKYILGAQGNVWTEYISNESKLQYSIFPRMIALSEVLWTPKKKRNWTDFEKRLPVIFERLQMQKMNYSKAYFDLRSTILPTADHKGVLWKLSSVCNDCNILLKNELSPGDSVSNISSYYSTPVKFESFPFQKTTAYLLDEKNDTLSHHSIKLNFNKATGKTITLTIPPSSKYPGDGAFTLIDGIQNEKGLNRSTEFLGFNNTDCEAIIDLGDTENIGYVNVHALELPSYKIWHPQTAEVAVSNDGKNFTKAGSTNEFIKKENGNGIMVVKFTTTPCRYLKIKIINSGTISQSKPSWLLIDELEVD